MPSGGGAARGPYGPEGQHGCLFLQLGVVLLSPQTLVLSSTGTTPSGTNRPSSNPAWCFSPREPLFLRRRAPRPQARTRVPPVRRGAFLPANPCSFVDEHHAPGSNACSTGSAWCFTPRKPLSVHRRAPRPRAQTGLPPARPHLDVGNGIAVSFCSSPKSKKGLSH